MSLARWWLRMFGGRCDFLLTAGSGIRIRFSAACANGESRLPVLRGFPIIIFIRARDRERIESDAKKAGADALLCTEKDFFNFGAAWRGALPVFYARVSIEMQNADAFWTAAEEILAERRPGISL